ncbi:EmrB/QacA subfamily drug resistance transporter [Streptacidiphilus sp. MAP12-20]|uniref:MFS transporter n=1 Tax=Streptacidiphilus sp. MAP12-20 TaxID=3156299 RepID=UPI00351268B4
MSTTAHSVDPDPPATADPDADTDTGHPLRWVALGVVLLAEIMDLLDTTIVNVAAPAIRSSLGGGTAQIQWISAAYTLSFAVLLITGARLGDLFGRKRMFVIGSLGFTLCSALCAAAADSDMLIGSRALQGGFAALMIPQGLGIIRSVFSAKEVGGAFAAFGPVMGLSSVLGPTLGGFLVSADAWGTGWRLVFLINLPLGLAAALLGARVIPADTAVAEARRLDLPGVALLSTAVVLLVYPLVQGRELGWPLWTYLAMAASLPVFGLFAVYQRRLAATDRSPLVEPTLFQGRSFRSSVVVVALFSAAMSGLMLTFTLTLQLGAHWTPLHAGATLIPLSLGIVAGAIASGAALGPRFGRKVIHAGVAIMVLGTLALWASFAHWGLAIDSWQLLPALLLTGIGMGLLMGPLFDIALAGVSDEESGSASGVLNALQQLGGSVGVATLGTAFFSWSATHGTVTATGWTLGCVALGLLLAGAAALAMPRMPREGAGH